jgi:hypothetical protein
MKNILILTLLFTLGSCSFYTNYVPTNSKVYPKTNPEDIEYYTGDIDREYEVIASFAVDVYGDEMDAIEYLQEENSLIGADAVINLELHTPQTNLNSRTYISGVAIKFK